jgi:hypothetical protein
MIRLRQAAKAPVLENREPVINSHPQIPGVIFQQRSHLTTTWTANRGYGTLTDVIEVVAICNPDGAVSSGQNAYGQIFTQPFRC